MANSGSERKTLTIWAGQGPTGETEPHPKDMIRWLLGTAQNDQIMKAASAYDILANALVHATVGIMTHAGKILTIWQGPDADKARVALALMYATGRELALKFADTGWSLQRYAGYIPTAIAEVDGIKVDRNDARVQELIRFNEQYYRGISWNGNEVTLVEDAMAQEALKRLNEKIRDLQITSLPSSVTYELPAVASPSVSGASTSVVHQNRNGTEGASSGTPSTGGDGGNAAETNGAGDAGSRNEGSTGGTTGGKPDGGSPPSSRPEVQPAQEQHSDKDQGDAREEQGGEGRPATPEQPDGQAADRDRSLEANTDDETTAPVIGAGDRAPYDDANTDLDSTQTETSAYQPPSAVVPATIGETPASTATPTSAPTPTVTAPRAPTSISPNGSYTPAGALASLRGGNAAGTSSMPYMPLMGAGGAMGDQVGGDMERRTYMPEDKSFWNGSSQDVTDPVIG
ncbi:hypothetical protein ACIBQ1_34220 [Nonomuraea sp. NPDC050153]|uniref:hypothetical protein n=1 Tax=Nonomuraea sp. NPDC050153 TaxID=3364359 RepID=UPI0037B46D35